MLIDGLLEIVNDIPGYVSKRSFCKDESTSWFWVNPQQGREGRQFSPLTFDLDAAASQGYGDCCPIVVDPKVLLVLLSFIGAATYFLRLRAISLLGRRKKRSIEPSELDRIQDKVFKGIETIEDSWISLGLSPSGFPNSTNSCYSTFVSCYVDANNHIQNKDVDLLHLAQNALEFYKSGATSESKFNAIQVSGLSKCSSFLKECVSAWEISDEN